MQVIAALLLSCWGERQKVPKHHFRHFRSSEQHTDGFDWLATYDFLLVFYSGLGFNGTTAEL